jgi:glycosyltransferase involved in cell wall biosynthesis
MTTPDISVCIVTYNQEEYIERAISGALMQRTNVPHEILISDDHSTDGTLRICREYKQKYPDIIRLIKQPNNLGCGLNWASALAACRGKYIALCEGDDYFIDHHKLERQRSFMEANPWNSFCSHEVYVHHELLSPSVRSAVGILIDNIRLSGISCIPELILPKKEAPQFFSRRRMYRGHSRYYSSKFADILQSQLRARFIHTASIFGKGDVLRKFPVQLLENAGFHRTVLVWLAMHGWGHHEKKVSSMRVIQKSSSAITKREWELSKEKNASEKAFLKALRPFCSLDQKAVVDRELAHLP